MNKLFFIFFIFLSTTTYANDTRLNLHLSCDSKTECIDIPLDGKTISVRKTPEMILDSSNIKELNEGKDEYGQLSLTIRLNDSAAARFAEITGNNIMKNLAIVLDGKALMNPMIRQKIGGGVLSITLGVGEKRKFWADIPWIQEKIVNQKQVDQNAKNQNTTIYVVGGLAILAGAMWYGFKGRKG